MARIFIFSGFVQGRQDFPSDPRAFSLTSFEACSSLNKDKSWKKNKGLRFYYFP